MKKLEYARKMTEIEWSNIVEFHRSRFDSKKELSELTINIHYKNLLDSFYMKEQEYLSVNKKALEIKSFYKKAKEADLCICGGKLNWVKGYNFWGCSEYKNNNVDHKNFKGKEIFVWEKPVLKNYITDIIRDNGLKDKLSAKSLLNFYLKEGKIDLLEKYGLGSSWNQIDRYVNVKRIADDFERRTEAHLRTVFHTVQPQFKVIYKYCGEKEKHCILDFLCSDNASVFIYECKTSKYDKKDNQKELYIDVIQKIIDTLKIDKQLYFRYAIENELA